ncbi:MAG: zf-HC2 domain-containing protein [Candidatus Omnitrophica bacterium]|nr:zf-HC2 domain-containing protein [Candidatus Omnitrophota bacterium]MDD5237506.1 zf-HC2 domain-containing protein [Candidatus Omnitrophota bacterium]
MDCSKIKELLLTDYLDKQADVRLRIQVQKHLGACAECRRFEEEVRMAAVSPFKNAAKPEAPESVWINIKDNIARSESRKLSLLDVITGKLKVFSLPRPAFALASTTLVFLIIFAAITKHSADKNQIREYFAQQIDFYAMLSNGEDNGYQNHTPAPGVYIEKYLF